MIQTIPLIYSSSEFDLFFHGTHLKNENENLKTLFHNTLNQICPSGPLLEDSCSKISIQIEENLCLEGKIFNAMKFIFWSTINHKI